MTYKTILLHVNDQRRVATLVDVAARLAAHSAAHLIGMYVVPPVPTFGATPIGAGMISGGLAAFRDEAERVRVLFEEACKGQPIVAEWRQLEPRRRGVAETLLDHGRTADLIVAGQRDPDFDFTNLLDVPERLAMESGRPVLIVPRVGKYALPARRVTIAWNGRREAARATFDALPLLQAAESVRLVWVNPQAEPRAAGDVPTAEIATTLARHGIRCEAASTATAAEIGVGDALLSGLCDDGSDLLVMGAYGHNRFREMILGGTTQHILDRMTAPVLLAH